jgi:hypothetical protein
MRGRKRNKSSNKTFYGIGLTKEEDEKLIALMKLKDISGLQLQRFLFREWINHDGAVPYKD